MKHLSEILPYYLSHGLRIKRGERNLVMNAAQESSVHWIGILAVIRWFNSDMVSKPIPILMPLSELTTPMIDGSTPIVEMAKIAYPKANTYIHMKGEICFIDAGESYVFGYVESEQSFICTLLPKNKNCFVNNQLQLFEYLFANHFDVFGLIESGRAIDKRTV